MIDSILYIPLCTEYTLEHIIYNCHKTKLKQFTWKIFWCGNDPSAGSPTETLLRLLLPLNDRVWRTFRLGVVVANLPEPVQTPH